MAGSGRSDEKRYVPKPVATLVIIQGRTQLLREECDQAAVAYSAEQEQEGASLFSPIGFRLWTFLSLWLAYLYVLVEGYRDAYKHGYPMSDPEIDQLLQSDYTEMLRRFRNKVFHPEAFNHDAIKAVFDEHENVRHWAGQLTDGLKAYLLAYVKTL